MTAPWTGIFLQKTSNRSKQLVRNAWRGSAHSKTDLMENSAGSRQQHPRALQIQSPNARIPLTTAEQNAGGISHLGWSTVNCRSSDGHCRATAMPWDQPGLTRASIGVALRSRMRRPVWQHLIDRPCLIRTRDAQACARYLIRHGPTSPGILPISRIQRARLKWAQSLPSIAIDGGRGGAEDWRPSSDVKD